MSLSQESIDYIAQRTAQAAEALVKARAEYVQAWAHRRLCDIGSNEPEQEAVVMRRLLESAIKTLCPEG